MQELLENLPPVVMLVLALLLVVWLVLLLFVPFMIESIRGSTRKSYAELEQLNKKVDRLIALLDERAAYDERRDEAALRAVEQAPRARREPPISG